MHADQLQGSTAWQRIRREFATREFATVRQVAAQIPGVDVDALHRLIDPYQDTLPAQADIVRMLRGAFARAAGQPDGLATVAALVYGFCLQRWEHSTDHAAVSTLAAAGQEAYRSARENSGLGTAGDPADDVEAGHLLLDLAGSLTHCMAVENALNCSCPVDMQHHAIRAATAARQVLAQLPGEPGTDTAAQRFVREAAEVQHEYFSAIVRVAGAVEVFIDEPARSVAPLDAAIEAAERAESTAVLRGDVYEGELRAHRLTLTAMRELSATPVLHVDSGRIAYCYPFAIVAGITPPQDVVRCVDGLRPGDKLGAARVRDAGRLDVTDVWAPADVDGRAYTGSMVRLEDLLIVNTAGEELAPHHVELRVSRIGICYLRIWSWLDDVSVHQLNQAMRRGAAPMGAERIQQAGSLPGHWSRLVEYAAEVIEGFQRQLKSFAVRQVGTGVHPTSLPRILLDIQRRQHTVLSLRSLSLRIPNGTGRRLYAFADVDGAVGAPLFHQRVNNAAATLEEYVRNHARITRSLQTDVGFAGEVLVRNPDCTVIAMPTSPNFLIIGYEEMAEFGAALPALLDQWIVLISEQRRSLSSHLPSMEAVWQHGRFDRQAGKMINTRVQELAEHQTRLRDAVAEARSMLAFVRSPALCNTTQFRELLDSLFQAAALDRLEADLEAQIARVDALYIQVETIAAQLEELRKSRYRGLVETTLAFLAVMSLAEFFSLLNDARGNRNVIIVEVAIVIVAAAIVAVVATRTNKRGTHGSRERGPTDP